MHKATRTATRATTACLLHTIIEDDDCPVCDDTAFAAVMQRAERKVELRTLDLVLG